MFDRAAFEEYLARINDLQLWDYEVSRLDEGTVLILGSNDFAYSHYLEAEFRDVTFTDLPAQFSHARFRLGRDSSDEATVWVTAESILDVGTKEYEIRASAMTLRVGRVYYYERENLQPGERIAGRSVRNDRS